MNRKQFLKALAASGAVIAARPASLLAAARGTGPEEGGSIAEVPLAPRPARRAPTLFIELPAGETGILTENNYADPVAADGERHDPRVFEDRVHEFDVGAIGTGVAIGDYDGDGRADIFVVSKTESCRLFRNLGGWKFEDVTDKAGVGDKGEAARIWKQGATFVDIDNNGLLDLYVCRFNAPNLLYVNQGDGTFREEAAARGLAVKDASVMAAFCDYDRDGRLDVFLQTNLLDAAEHPNGQRDYLFRNNGDGTFTDVTDKAGISGEAQGHSAIWWDYDGDGWPDLYVANDFAQPDKLYHNNRDGTFTDVIDSVVPHMPLSSMGSDLGDINNDGLMDLFVADMAATTHEKDQRTMASERRENQDPPDSSTSAPQFPRNALYVNTGAGRVLEAAELAGVAATDWTWSVRLEDLDNDGRLDLFVTNGMHREVTNVDLIMRVALAERPEDKLRIERSSPVLSERHLAFRNLGGLRFSDVSAEWGLDKRGVSFGAALGDLSGDGNLDIVYSNYRKGVTVMRNECDSGHRVIVALHGTRSNRYGVGATVRIESASGRQVRTLVLARGVLSSSEPVLHFGLGEDTRILRMTLSWPSGHEQVFTDLGVDRRFTITEPATPAHPAAVAAPPAGQFEEVSAALGLSLTSREAPLDELVQQPLLPMRQNRRGPSIAVAEFSRGAGPSVLVGGTAGGPLRMLRRGASGQFTAADLPAAADNPLGDGPILVFDADGDGLDDILVTKSGTALAAGAAEYEPRLLMNDGRGGFRAAGPGALPALGISAGALAAADFDRSGRLGVFIGARVLPGQYPLFPRSALLANRGGRFEDVTDQLAPGLREVGMVTSALWSDADGDGWPDLLLTTEWGQVRYFHNDGGKGFTDWTQTSGFGSAGTGWWTSIASADFNGDGLPDYVVGNVGLNTQYHVSPEHPALLFYGDFAGNGSAPQIVEAYYEGDRLYPWRTRRDLGASIPSILRRYPRNDTYARATLEEILGKEKIEASQRFAATELRSGTLIRGEAGVFRFGPLPLIAQVSPIQGLVACDLDGDGNADICAVQNSYSPIPPVGRFDGGLGQLLRGDGKGCFTPVPPSQSGIVVPGDAKALAVADLDADGWPDLLVSRNNGSTLAFRNRGADARRCLAFRLRGRPGNPSGIGANIRLRLRSGAQRAAEVHSGSGYFSQSSPACFFGWNDADPPVRADVRWPDGSLTRHEMAGDSASVTLAVS